MRWCVRRSAGGGETGGSGRRRRETRTRAYSVSPTASRASCRVSYSAAAETIPPVPDGAGDVVAPLRQDTARPATSASFVSTTAATRSSSSKRTSTRYLHAARPWCRSSLGSTGAACSSAAYDPTSSRGCPSIALHSMSGAPVLPLPYPTRRRGAPRTSRRTTSTFSCDIAYSDSPTASRASARSRTPRTRRPFRVESSTTCQTRRLDLNAATLPRPCTRRATTRSPTSRTSSISS